MNVVSYKSWQNGLDIDLDTLQSLEYHTRAIYDRESLERIIDRMFQELI